MKKKKLEKPKNIKKEIIKKVEIKLKPQKIKKIRYDIRPDMSSKTKLSKRELKDLSLKAIQIKQELKKITIGQEESTEG